MSVFSRVKPWCLLGATCLLPGSIAACAGRDAPPATPGGNAGDGAGRDLAPAAAAVTPDPVRGRAAGGSPWPDAITGDVTTTTVPGFLEGRRVWVYLPPGYDDSPEASYPVLYMLDGQNVFDASTSYAGEWHVDEICEALIAGGEVEPVIVVGVDNARAGRLDEYAPWPDPDARAGGGGDAHLRAIVDVLVPYIDDGYRTRAEPQARGIAGSSLGGLMALYAAYAYPETFGLAAGFSPSLEWDLQHLTRFIAARARPGGSRVYMDMGTRERRRLVDGDGNDVADEIDVLRALRDVMTGQGFVLGTDLMVVEAEGAVHHETSWTARFPGMLRFLLPPDRPPAPGDGH
jgi:predicted alpha/beta superfamily hydrolase